jgi:tetratricopeptide (TPR) repeat protein
MKKLAASIIDLLFFVSLLFVSLLFAVVIIYSRERDISLINTLLQTELTPTLLIAYAVITVLFIVYAVVLPTVLGATVGQKLFNYTLMPKANRNLFTVFMYTIVGSFWKGVLFPYSIFLAIKKRPQLNSRLSTLELLPSEGKMSVPVIIASVFFTVALVVTAGFSTYIYRAGLAEMIEKYTDYEKQTVTLIEKQAFQDASNTLEKYKQYNGETASYFYYKCEILGNLSTEETNIEVCTKATELNKDDKRAQVITLMIARTLAANGKYADAEKKYAELWTTYEVRTLDMKDYVVVLSELGKAKDATAILTEVAKNVSETDYLGLKDIAILYERVGNLDLALTTYQNIIKSIPENSNVELVGETNYYIGVIQYKKAKYADAKKSFEAAKTLNKDFAEPADSYIILISKLGGSVTK